MKVSGNILSLINYGNLTKYCFSCLFFGSPLSLISAKDLILPADNLQEGCFHEMFYNCINLKDTPKLKATKLADSCYEAMFSYCKMLTAIPKLPATTLAQNCYSYMFAGCTSLTTAPELPATTLTYGCYSYMFADCTSLTTASELPATNLATFCYQWMFKKCTNLTTAPELPATNLAEAYSCYYGMFCDCTSLRIAPALPASTLADYCYQCIFENCTNLTNPPELPAITLTKQCYSQMFQNCTSLTTAPALPASTLASQCYYRMFYSCTNLNSISADFTNWNDALSSTFNWVSGVSPTGIFECPDELPRIYNWSAIPYGWTTNITELKEITNTCNLIQIRTTGNNNYSYYKVNNGTCFACYIIIQDGNLMYCAPYLISINENNVLWQRYANGTIQPTYKAQITQVTTSIGTYYVSNIKYFARYNDGSRIINYQNLNLIKYSKTSNGVFPYDNQLIAEYLTKYIYINN